MIEVTPIKKVTGVTIVADEEVARALKLLAGLGTIDFSTHADLSAKLYGGFDNMAHVVRVVQNAGVSEAIGRGLR